MTWDSLVEMENKIDSMTIEELKKHEDDLKTELVKIDDDLDIIERKQEELQSEIDGLEDEHYNLQDRQRDIEDVLAQIEGKIGELENESPPSQTYMISF